MSIKTEEFKFLAQLHGAKFKNSDKSTSEAGNAKVPLFGDPETYSHMSDIEKENLTKNMMGKHKTWSGTTQL